MCISFHILADAKNVLSHILSYNVNRLYIREQNILTAFLLNNLNRNLENILLREPEAQVLFERERV